MHVKLLEAWIYRSHACLLQVEVNVGVITEVAGVFGARVSKHVIPSVNEITNLGFRTSDHDHVLKQALQNTLDFQ
jgi:hypothetical protein